MADIVAAVSNPCAPDPRVERQAEWLREQGHSVTIHAFDREHRFESTDDTIRHRVGMTPYSSRIATFKGKRKFIRSLNLKGDLLICHDADTLGVKFEGPRIFDMHDLAHTWITDGNDTIIRRILAKLAMKRMLKRAKSCSAVITSCEGFKQWLKSNSINSTVVENRPKKTGIVSQGNFLGYVGRVRHYEQFQLLNDVLKSMDNSPPLLIAGDGVALKEVKKMMPYAVFSDEFNEKELPQLLEKCGVMFAMYDPKRENIAKGALPVKMFDAAAHGIPSIVSANTPMAEVCLNENLGVAVEWGNKKALARAITDTFGMRVSLNVDAERERNRFLNVVNSILPE